MSFIDWSDPEEMLSLLVEYVEDELNDSHEYDRRRRFLSKLMRQLSDLEERFSTLRNEERPGALRSMLSSIDAEFENDPAVEHLADCAGELERINIQNAAAPGAPADGFAGVNGVRLFYELTGNGTVPLVLVHGSWGSHHDWDLVVPRLADAFRVLTYDRRGHSHSERPTGQGSMREDVADLAALIEHLGLVPAWVVGNSFGASIALRLAGTHPKLLRGLIGHEPPLFSLLADDPAFAPLLEEVRQRMGAVVERITAGDHAGAAEQFVETVALGPGTWAQVPPEARQTLIENAPTFLDEARDPEQLGFDLAWLRRFSKPVLLTLGDESPPPFAPVVAKLAGAIPRAEVVTLPGAGHIPHATHPKPYVETMMSFMRKHLT